MPKIKKKLTLSDLVVLSLLAESPMHGYEIVSQLEYRDAKDWAPVSRPQVYYSINKLFEMHFVEPLSNKEPSQGPERAQFKINQKGLQALNDSLASDEWAIQRQPPPFLTWMALSSNLSKRDTKKVIRKRQHFLSEELERERKTLVAIEAESGPMNLAARLMVMFTIQSFDAELSWLGEVEDALSMVRK